MQYKLGLLKSDYYVRELPTALTPTEPTMQNLRKSRPHDDVSPGRTRCNRYNYPRSSGAFLQKSWINIALWALLKRENTESCALTGPASRGDHVTE